MRQQRMVTETKGSAWTIAKLSGLALLLLGAGLSLHASRQQPAVSTAERGRAAAQADVDAIQNELQQLRREAVKLRTLVEQAPSAVAPEHVRDEERTSSATAAPLAAAKPAESAAQYLAKVGEAFAREPADPRWNPAGEIEGKVAAVMPKGASLDVVECRTTMCRLQTTHPTAESYVALTRAFLVPSKDGPLWKGPAVFSDLDAHAAQKGKTSGLIYLGKESLPDSATE